jgi:hypothetical protein
VALVSLPELLLPACLTGAQAATASIMLAAISLAGVFQLQQDTASTLAAPLVNMLLLCFSHYACLVSHLRCVLPDAVAAGVLASKYGHDASELGGPVTEALQHAQLSTRARVQDLEARTKAMHRCVRSCVCAFAVQLVTLILLPLC